MVQVLAKVQTVFIHLPGLFIQFSYLQNSWETRLGKDRFQIDALTLIQDITENRLRGMLEVQFNSASLLHI